MALLYLKGVRETLWPVLKESQFIEKGVLTPEEFIEAGDAVVRMCPTWAWESGDPARRRHYLPADKQYLITRGVPSRHRVADMEGEILMDDFSQMPDGESEWMIPAMRVAQATEASDHPDLSGGRGSPGPNALDDDGYEDLALGTAALDLDPPASGLAQSAETEASTSLTNLNFALVDDYVDASRPAGEGAPAEAKAAEAQVSDADAAVPAAPAAAVTAAVPPEAVALPSATAAPGAVDGDDDDEYTDILDFEDASLAMDPATMPSVAAAVSAAGPGGAAAVAAAEVGDDTTVKTRRYDVSISYDKYWQSPRIWLFGLSESGVPLRTEETFEDIISDYRERTVTIDPHPHTGVPHASIHPCQHAATMKRIVQNIVDGGGAAPRADQYIFVFLKFIQSVVPTIDYDYTMQVEGRRA